MKILNHRLAFLAAALLASCAAPAPDPNVEQQAIRAQIAKYTASVDAADANLAAQVWRTSEMSFIHPAGHAHNWQEIKAFYAFFATTFTERKLVARDISIHVNGDSAWAEFYWHFDAKPAGGGAPVQSDGRESQVYVRNGERWELVHAHYSSPAMEFQQ